MLALVFVRKQRSNLFAPNLWAKRGSGWVSLYLEMGSCTYSPDPLQSDRSHTVIDLAGQCQDQVNFGLVAKVVAGLCSAAGRILFGAMCQKQESDADAALLLLGSGKMKL